MLRKHQQSSPLIPLKARITLFLSLPPPQKNLLHLPFPLLLPFLFLLLRQQRRNLPSLDLG